MNQDQDPIEDALLLVGITLVILFACLIMRGGGSWEREPSVWTQVQEQVREIQD